MHVVDIIRTIVFFILLFICAYTDYKKGKIYNKYLMMSLLAFVLIYVVTYIVYLIIGRLSIRLINEKIVDSAFGFIIGFLIGVVFYLIGIFKGGDAKLLAVVGLYIGKKNIVFHFSVIIIIAGIAALIVMLRNKVFIKKARRIILYFKGIILKRKFERYTVDPDDNIKFPFAVYVLLGEIVIYMINYMRG